MATPLFRDFKKQASFFLKEKFKTARLALTDVTPAELMTEEVTRGNPWAPDSPTLRSISRAAFELDDYWRIVEILHKRLLKFERKNWRASYNSLIVVEHLLTHGPESVAEEFQSDKDVISQMKDFHYTDDSGFNWGVTVRKKSERILKLMEEGTLLKEERNRARNLSRGIQGFGSFSQRSTQEQGVLHEKSLPTTFDRSNSDFNNGQSQENQSFGSHHFLDTAAVKSPTPSHEGGFLKSQDDCVEPESYLHDHGNAQMHQKFETSSKEMMTPCKEFHLWNLKGESNPLLDGNQENDSRLGMFTAEDDHPFNSKEMHSTSSLLPSG
ncbi:epsin-3-like [Vigna unguiculata]|uniref:Epsin n=1 Tax=Vigna unguiculata TaxID=3917 RepID=A0A4D6N5Z3_VIGUN|nr:epsin-3-like [Vigna unguiculata]QCE09230.1 epsin [Vigna unguiculata]